MSGTAAIYTIKKSGEYKHKEKGSVFIGRAFQVQTEAESKNLLELVRRKNYDAAHNCFAYLIYHNIKHYSDDGEPSGSAGIRILNAIEHLSLSNVLVIVTRYFGGVKLGVGPLGRTYYFTALRTLEDSGKMEIISYVKLKIYFSFEFTSLVHRAIDSYGAKGIENKFHIVPIIECLVKTEFEKSFISELMNASKGAIKVEKIVGNLFI